MAQTTVPTKSAGDANANAAEGRVRRAVDSLEFLGTLPTELIQVVMLRLKPAKVETIARVTKVISGIAIESIRSPQATHTGSTKGQPPAAFVSQAEATREQLVGKGEIVTAGTLMAKLHVTRQALSKAVKAHRLFTVDVGSTRFYPAFFADEGFDRRNLERIAKELGELPGWSKWQFFTTPKSSLGGVTPLEALKRGRYAEARRAAIGFAER